MGRCHQILKDWWIHVTETEMYNIYNPSKIFTASRCPLSTAIPLAVWPCEFLNSASIPFSNRNRTQPSALDLAAQCSAVSIECSLHESIHKNSYSHWLISIPVLPSCSNHARTSMHCSSVLKPYPPSTARCRALLHQKSPPYMARNSNTGTGV